MEEKDEIGERGRECLRFSEVMNRIKRKLEK